VLDAARAALAPAATDTAPIDAAIDVPLLLHLAAQQGVRGIVLDALLARREAAGRLGRTDGITLDDLKARRLAVTTRSLEVMSLLRRALALLDHQGIRAACAPNAGLAMMASGVASFQLERATVLVAPEFADAASECLNADESLQGCVRVDSALPSRTTIAADVAGVLNRCVEIGTPAGPLRVLDAADQAEVIDARLATPTARVADVVALAAIRACPIDAGAVRRVLEANTPATARHDADRPRALGDSAELWIAGFPSAYGGADTELDHLIDLLRRFGVAVHLVPMFGAGEEYRTSVLARGCHVHDYAHDIFAGKIVASFCNGGFLAMLPAIVRFGAPARVIWFNCMTWLFDREKTAHARGWIDVFGYQSQYQRNMLMPQLEALGPVRSFPYRPYFNAARVAWRYREWSGTYRIGRISRDDGAKYALDTWRIFEGVRPPAHLRKQVFVLGYGANAAARIGPPPPGLDCHLWAPGEVPAEQFYNGIDTLIHKTGGSRENAPRVLFEAYAHGVVPIVERAFAFPEMIVHGETGYMASSSEEMIALATHLAHHPEEHRRLAENGRRHLDAMWGADACWQPWADLLGARAPVSA
jgi:hypothetical protein